MMFRTIIKYPQLYVFQVYMGGKVFIIRNMNANCTKKTRKPSKPRRCIYSLHKAPCGRTHRGDRLGPSPPSAISANCLNLNQKKCKFLYDGLIIRVGFW